MNSEGELVKEIKEKMKGANESDRREKVSTVSPGVRVSGAE